MNHFQRRLGALHAEKIPLDRLARAYGTPLYVYSAATLRRHWKVLDRSLSGVRHLVCYAAKANANLAILDLLARMGAGFDIVSGGELYRVLKAGGDPRKVVFSGVGQDRRGDRLRPLAGGEVPQRRERAGAGPGLGGGPPPGRARPRCAPGESRRRPEDPPLHRDRPEEVQVRRLGRGRAAPLPPGGRGPGPRRPGRGLPHRLPDHDGGPLPRRHRPGAEAGPRLSRGRGSGSATSTSAAGWGSSTRTRTPRTPTSTGRR